MIAEISLIWCMECEECTEEFIKLSRKFSFQRIAMIYFLVPLHMTPLGHMWNIAIPVKRWRQQSIALTHTPTHSLLFTNAYQIYTQSLPTQKSLVKRSVLGDKFLGVCYYYNYSHCIPSLLFPSKKYIQSGKINKVTKYINNNIEE